MKAFVTYCSADKDESIGNLPAISRYRSQRIRQLHEAALRQHIGFFILSGKYGLLAPDDPIEYYDHLLLPGEAPNLSKKVGRQLGEHDIREVHFHTVDVHRDRNVQAYIDCMAMAAQDVGAAFYMVIVDFED